MTHTNYVYIELQFTGAWLARTGLGPIRCGPGDGHGDPLASQAPPSPLTVTWASWMTVPAIS